ncbi:mannosylglucosyl-3-phosphoglycerate phosphatase-like isoform X2 [Centruroides vittatus]|uniref:mannosylglucosyl-3-phosphoglycerate phosphatase-like isoform X2 n=1 Tax=Centruroides vittatus TaxID=120091 RepID=UPI00350FC93F
MNILELSKLNSGNENMITILHFNDVYNVEPRDIEPVGGAARFSTAMKSFSHLDPLIIFSGDVLSPSVLSTFTHGEHMIDVLNILGVHCSVYGNHEFDFGVDRLLEFAERTKFPWLMSNVIDKETNEPLGSGNITYILEHHGKKFGFIGLVEKEWLVTLATVDIDDVIYLDFVDVGEKLAKQLKENDQVDFVIAITHMRFPNDCHLAEKVEEIDLILGGHDHVYDIKVVNGKYIIKSGSDFQKFSKITLTFGNPVTSISIDEITVTSKYEEDPELKEILKNYEGVVAVKMDEVLAHFSVDLDGRFSSVRTMETNIGNFVCDVMLAATHADLTILNSGTIRCDRIYPKGPFKMRDLITVLPLMDPMVVLKCTGYQVWKALENGVSQYPRLDGRFPQVAGISFKFDPMKPPGERIDPVDIKVGFEPLDMNQVYLVATKKYCALGRDGYEALKKCEIITDEENTPELCISVQNHFRSIKFLTGAARQRSHHRQSLFCVSRRASLLHFDEIPSFSGLMRSMSCDTIAPDIPLVRTISIEEIEHEQCRLAPKVEGRIQILTEEFKEKLEREKSQLSILNDVIEEVSEL